jgi:thioredoxin
MKKITTQDFKEIIYDFEKNKDFKFKGNKPAIIDFYAEWCGPCKMIAPVLEELEKDGSFNLYKVDTDEEYELSKHFNIRSIPTILFVPVEGKPVSHTGSFPKSELKKFISKYFGV